MAVYRLSDAVADLSREEAVQFLLGRAVSSQNGVARLCFHRFDTSALQLMLIAIAPGRSFPLHLHNKKTEFLLHVAGSGVVEVCADDKSNSVLLDERSRESGVVFIPRSTWHSVSAGPQGLALFEFTQGPFRSSDTVLKPD